MNGFRAICLAGLLLCAAGVSAQGGRWELGLRGSYVMHHLDDIQLVGFGSADVDVSWFSAPQLRAEGSDKSFSYGLRASFSYIPHGIAGHRFGIVGLVKAPLFGRLDYHIGLGLSAFTRPQSITHDTTNIYISSLLNCLIDVGFDYRLCDRLSLSLALTHSSNGMLHRPNKGLNFYQLGVAYSLAPYSLSATPFFDTSFPPHRHEIGFTLSGGAVMSPIWWQEGLYPCYDVSLNYQYHLSNVFSVGATVDLWYNFTHVDQLRWREIEIVPVYVSAMPMMEGKWGPVSIRAGIGPVLYASMLVRIRFYERVGVYYNFGKHYAGVGLNAHSGIIEFIEWSYGYRLPL